MAISSSVMPALKIHQPTLVDYQHGTWIAAVSLGRLILFNITFILETGEARKSPNYDSLHITTNSSGFCPLIINVIVSNVL